MDAFYTHYKGQLSAKTRRKAGRRDSDCYGVICREDGMPYRGQQIRMAMRRVARIALDDTKLVSSPFTGGVVCMDLDKTEDRFLLAGGADTTLAVFDTHASTQVVPVFSFRRQGHSHAHKFMISSVAWYPVDSGLFVSGSHDCSVKLWDTNELEVVCSFQLPKKVTSVAMSALAAAHTLIACGCEDSHVRLCDPASGAISHVFSGHRDSVWCVAWSAASEYEVYSGDACGQIRLWDIRRAGCRAVLDQYVTQREAEQPPAREGPLPGVAATRAKKQRRGGGAGKAAAPLSLHASSSAPSLLLSTEPASTSSAIRMKESAVRAHSGAVSWLLPCPDAIHLLTAGTDGRMRLWDARYRINRLVGYEGTHNRAIRARQLAITEDARAVFYPTGSVINVYEVETGRTLASLHGGHKESINCCVYNPSLRELYSGANDFAVRVWSCVAGQREAEEELEEERPDRL